EVSEISDPEPLVADRVVPGIDVEGRPVSEGSPAEGREAARRVLEVAAALEVAVLCPMLEADSGDPPAELLVDAAEQADGAALVAVLELRRLPVRDPHAQGQEPAPDRGFDAGDVVVEPRTDGRWHGGWRARVPTRRDLRSAIRDAPLADLP